MKDKIKFRLPSKKEFKNLIKCPSKWNMEDKLYYIYGSEKDSGNVKRALREIYPNAENLNRLDFDNPLGVYYVVDDVIYFSGAYSVSINLIKKFGIELQPKKQEKFVEKTMYKAVVKGSNDIPFQTGYVFANKKDALETPGAIGYQEIKVMIKE